MGLIDELKREGKSPIHLEHPREALGDLFREMGFTVGAEIGTFKGRYAASLLKANPSSRLYCIDPWLPYADLALKADEFSDVEEIARARLKFYDVRFLKMPSMAALECFDDESLDFVYIDGGHDFLNVALDLWHWSPKVRKGGIVAGHDYARMKRQNNLPYGHHVAEVVDAWVDGQRIKPWYTIGGRIKDDAWRSFFWVKT